MVNTIRSFLLSNKKRRLINNFVNLSLLQAANFILPLVTLPYLVRILGPEYIGLLAFATATMAYFVLVTNYGFNLSATRQISINRDDPRLVEEIFSSVMSVKVLLGIFSLLLMSIVVFTFEKFREDWVIYYLSFGVVIGNILFPVWLFQGMEKMKYIVYLNILSKTIFVVAIFIFVNKKADYVLVPLINSLGYIVSAILSLILVRKHYGISFRFQSRNLLKEQLVEGWHIFFSSMAVSVYTISTTFILGILTNNTTVGYYSAGERIVKAVQALYAPASQAIYPYISNIINKSEEEGLRIIRKLSLVIGSVMLLLSSLLFYYSEEIVFILLGEQYRQSIIVVKILAFLPFLISMSNIYGIQTMLNLGRKVAFSRILAIASLIGIILSFVLVKRYEYIGSAITLLSVETMVTIMMIVYLLRTGINVIRLRK